MSQPVMSRLSSEDQVFAVLLDLGGAAHVDEIVERLVRERRRSGLVGGPPVRMIVESALHHMRAPDDRPHGASGARVYRPFGAASRRWAVCRDHAPTPAVSASPRLRRPVFDHA